MCVRISSRRLGVHATYKGLTQLILIEIRLPCQVKGCGMSLSNLSCPCHKPSRVGRIPAGAKTICSSNLLSWPAPLQLSNVGCWETPWKEHTETLNQNTRAIMWAGGCEWELWEKPRFCQSMCRVNGNSMYVCMYYMEEAFDARELWGINRWDLFWPPRS